MEPSSYLNLQQAHRQARINETSLRETLSVFERKKQDQTTNELLKQAQIKSREAMMPQVRIRNVSREYKLVAGVFSPELLKVEEGKYEEAIQFQPQN